MRQGSVNQLVKQDQIKPSDLMTRGVSLPLKDSISLLDVDVLGASLDHVMASQVLDAISQGVELKSLIEACPGAGKSTLARSIQRAMVELHSGQSICAGLSILTLTQSHAQAQDFLEKLSGEFLERHLRYGDVEIFALSGLKRSYETGNLSVNYAEYVRFLKDNKAILKAINSSDKPYKIVITNLTKMSYLTSGQSPDEVGKLLEMGCWDELGVFQTNQFDLVICDEAFQVDWGAYCELMRLSQHQILIGDSGQIRPFREEVLDECAWTVSGPTLGASLPEALIELANDTHPIQVIKLKKSYRLPQSTVDIIQPAFYPELPFSGVAMVQDRKISFASPNSSPSEDGFDKLMSEIICRIDLGQTLIAVELPEIEDTQLLEEWALYLMVKVRQRMLSLAIEVSLPKDISQPARALQMRPLLPTDTMFLVSKHAQVSALRQHLIEDKGCFDLTTLVQDKPFSAEHWQRVYALHSSVFNEIQLQRRISIGTANEKQGLEAPFAFALDPLLGQTEMSWFSLESGRTCVMTSRHTHCSLFFTSASVHRVLKSALTCPDRRLVNDPGQMIYQSYFAQHRFYQALAKADAVVRIQWPLD